MNFTIERDGEIFVGEVKAKEEAKKIYDKAKQEGKTAGFITMDPKYTSIFKIAVNVAGSSKVTFDLTYQELLERRLNLYENRIHIDPGQAVNDFRIGVNIQESREITKLYVPPLGHTISRNNITGQNSLATVNKGANLKSATITYQPTFEQQKSMSSIGTYGQFIIYYDVDRQSNEIEIHTADDYFIQYVAPQQGLTPLNKNIVFILDTSGSMSFRKMTQLKDAMLTILNQLKDGDYFTLMTFSSFFRYWKEDLQLFQKGSSTVTDAENFIKGMFAAGGTNINTALEKGLEFLKKRANTNWPSLIVFLTDGRASDGERNTTRILDGVQKNNTGKFNIYTLGFGSGVDMNFLKTLAYQNEGFERRIFTEADASIQLQEFYSEISRPLLTDVKIIYDENVIETTLLTKNKFDTYYSGSELVIAGKIKSDRITKRAVKTMTLNTTVEGYSNTGKVSYQYDINIVDGTNIQLPNWNEVEQFSERVWAYMKIKELLRQALMTQDENTKEMINNKTLEMSIQYNFVTPLTSMVVVLPDTKPTDKPDDNNVNNDKYKDWGDSSFDAGFGDHKFEMYPGSGAVLNSASGRSSGQNLTVILVSVFASLFIVGAITAVGAFLGVRKYRQMRAHGDSPTSSTDQAKYAALEKHVTIA